MRIWRRSPLVFVCIVFSLSCFYHFFSKPNIIIINTATSLSHPKNIIQKKVLIYAATKFFRNTITDKEFLDGCPQQQSFCHITSDVNDLSKADAVLFHNADFAIQSIPPKRLSIPYVLWSLESPYNDRFRPDNNFINWTMTYRLDADVWYPYGHVKKLETPIDYNLDDIWNLKNSDLSITWLASNCFTGNNRLKLIKELKRLGLKADLYGRCGKPAPDCVGVDRQSDACVASLIKPYKFYFAFENTNCRDYVTEKFYKSLSERMVVPIVMERKIYESVGAPNTSFIAISDFQNLNEFVKYIKDIENDKEKYLKHHEWRKHYRVVPEHHNDTGFCELCRRLQKPSPPKLYGNVAKWNSDGICDQSFVSRYSNR
ncbi:unnamed protein product [Auanema sp. JU1783]|nr:unnamed protein product [Auanema sp. JU1783]